MIEDDQGMRLDGCARFLGTKTNNEAEYLALIDGLKRVIEWKPDRLEIYMDSKLVVEQLNGKYKIKKAELQVLHSQVRALLNGLEWTANHVEREKNAGADALANRAIDERNKR